MTTSGSTVTWAPRLADAVAAGITSILFGAGVGISTDGVGSPPSDGYWFITKVQEYYLSPASLNEAPPPKPATLSIDDVTISEGNSGTKNAVFTVRLSAVQSQTVSVDFATANGTATSGSDYRSASGKLTFAAGETTKSIDVQILGDTIRESNEVFLVQLLNAAGASLAKNQGSGTIQDDDAPPASNIAVFTVTDDWGSDFHGGNPHHEHSNHDADELDSRVRFCGANQLDLERKILSQTGAVIESGQKVGMARSRPGATASFGFVGSRSSTSVVPTNYLLTSTDTNVADDNGDDFDRLDLDGEDLDTRFQDNQETNSGLPAPGPTLVTANLEEIDAFFSDSV
ncbi:MAG: Calx-beta domain-containing protein [Planctomycetota bacterium]